MSTIKEITSERGGDYGRPIDQFNTTQEMYKIWKDRRATGSVIDTKLDNVLNHIVYMCIDKMVRLAENPYKQDGYDDIQGYASLWEQAVNDFEEESMHYGT